jgi:methionine sulfoxide reductase catalytic subunit
MIPPNTLTWLRALRSHADRSANSQTMLAYKMNGQSLPIDHGAPLRLRLATQLGFTMVKYIRAIEFIENYKVVG